MTVCIGICITYTVVAGEDLRAAVADWAPPGTVPPAWAFFLMFAGAPGPNMQLGGNACAKQL